MGLFDVFKSKKNTKPVKETSLNSPSAYVDSSSIAPDELSFYQPDSYYTFYSYPGTHMATKVIPFDERKKTTYPSKRGLYVAEIMLLQYCDYGTYPKPSGGYPGFWWFKYGIRDIGHALESLEHRGFIKWTHKANSLKGLKVDALKSILVKADLPSQGKKQELIDRIIVEIPEEKIEIPNYEPKYELTELGRIELEENGYIPYMHKHKSLTTEDNRFGETFTVWDINKLFPNGDTKNWREVVGDIELKRFGVNMANAPKGKVEKGKSRAKATESQTKEMRAYLSSKKDVINRGINTSGDGYDEESKGLKYLSIGNDKAAIVQFYISIGKNFDAPALYRESAKLLRKYGMLDEELYVLECGLKNVPDNNRHWEEMQKRKNKVLMMMNKDNENN